MSTRWYPLYQKGNPQLRVFLPNFFMKLVKSSTKNTLPNRLEFHVSMGMSKHDVKNYLEKIYNLKVINVRTTIQMGELKKAPGKDYVIKEDDYKRAFVHIASEVNFEFPNLFPAEKVDKDYENEKKAREMMDAQLKKDAKRNNIRPDVPRWFA